MSRPGLRLILALFIDLLWVIMVVSITVLWITPQERIPPLGYLQGFIPMTWVAYLYLCHRVFGQSLGQFLTGIARLHEKTQEKTRYFFSWIFESKTEVVVTFSNKTAFLRAITAILGLTLLFGGLLVFSLSERRLLKKYKEEWIESSPLAAHESRLPFYYLSTSSTEVFGESIGKLDYRVGPPHKFIGEVEFQFRNSSRRLRFTGPLTLKSQPNVGALKKCLSRSLWCLETRRLLAEVFFKSALLQNGTVQNEIQSVSWFEFTNTDPSLRSGIHILTRNKTTKAFSESYWFVHESMAIQGVILDYNPEDVPEEVHDIFSRWIAKVVYQEDLKTQRSQINAQLAKFRAVPGSRTHLSKGVELLLSKLTVQPTDWNAYFFLAQTAHAFYEWAEQNGASQEAAAARSLIRSSYQYAMDVDPKNEKNSDLERLSISVR